MARRRSSTRGERAPADAILELLADRPPTATICPSEAARLVDPEGWRTRMDDVRDAAAALAAEGRVCILQRGRPVVGPTRGPIRIGRGPTATTPATEPLVTPDGRYLVVRGRLWRRTNPHLSAAVRERWVGALMDARRDVARAKRADDAAAIVAARQRVNEAKVALGERGPVWWDDGAPDDNRRMARTTRYAEWYAAAGTGR